MGSVNISIKKEAYRFLKSLKGRDESFSDVILGFKESEQRKGTAKGALRFWGVLEGVDWEAREKKMSEFREEFEERFK